MKRLLLLIAALGLATAAVTLSRSQNPSSADQTGDLRLAVEDRNPWTHLRLNNDPADFQFAIVSDRTGGHRARVFSQAIEQLNLLQPEFVLSVGDLIEGYSEDRPMIEGEWREFQGYVNQLQMPFFYVPGNHDLTNRFEAKLWQEKFGRRHYHFVYRNVLFLILNSEDPPGQLGSIGDEQLEYIRKALDDNKGVRWTVVAVHRPLWTAPDLVKNGWEAVEKALASRPYTVFAGHIHRFRKYVRQGRNYYQLATTGGGSRMRGVRYGEFDQIAWVTMKKDGPVIANILLDGVYDADMTKPVSEEEGVVSINRKPVQPVRGKVFVRGDTGAERGGHLSPDRQGHKALHAGRRCDGRGRRNLLPQHLRGQRRRPDRGIRRHRGVVEAVGGRGRQAGAEPAAGALQQARDDSAAGDRQGGDE